MRKLLLVAIIGSMLFSPALAIDFMTSARGGGIGFSYFLLADDPSGAVYNPAGVGFARGWQSYLMWNVQNNYDYTVQKEAPYNGRFAVVYPFSEIGTFAVNTHQSGSLEKITGLPTVNHGAATYAREIVPGLAAGASFKYMYETMFGERSAYDFDLGITYRSRPGVIGAVAVENITRAKLKPDYLGYQEYLPRRERVGLAYVVSSRIGQAAFTAAGQFEESGISEKYSTSLVNLGTEWWLLTNSLVSLGLRGGYTMGKGVRQDQDIVADYKGISGGFSVNFNFGVNDFRIDYGIKTYPYETSDGSQPLDHFVALSYGWGGVPDYSTKDVEYAEATSVPEQQQSASEQRETIPEKQPEQLAQEPSAATPQPVVQEQKPAAPAAPPAAPAQQASAPAQKPSAPTTQKPTAPAQQAVAPIQKPSAPAAQPTPPAQQAAVPTQKLESPKQQASVPAQQAATPAPKSTPPAQQASAPAPPPAAPTSIPAAPAQKSAGAEKKEKIDGKAVAQIPEAAKPSVPAVDKDTDFRARSFNKYDVIMDVTNISSAEFRRIVFYMKPQGIIKTINWKLYIFQAKIKDWSDTEIDRWALKVIEGKGVPPMSVVWDGTSKDGKFLPGGKYYYVLTAEDTEGQYYATKWYNFKLE